MSMKPQERVISSQVGASLQHDRWRLDAMPAAGCHHAWQPAKANIWTIGFRQPVAGRTWAFDSSIVEILWRLRQVIDVTPCRTVIRINLLVNKTQRWMSSIGHVGVDSSPLATILSGLYALLYMGWRLLSPLKRLAALPIAVFAPFSHLSPPYERKGSHDFVSILIYGVVVNKALARS